MKMRCGKTLACLDTAVALGRFPVLIIAPVTVLAGWENELLGDGWTPADIVKVVATSGWGPRQLQRKLFHPSASFFLVNYEQIKRVDALGARRRLLPGLGIGDWGTIIVDESYRIANDEGKLFEYLTRYPANPAKQHRFILSGAPASEHPLNFASQYIFLHGVYFGCRTTAEYRGKFWRWNEYTYKWEIRRESHYAEILAYIHATAFCTSLEDLGLGGRKLYRVDRVPLNEAQRSALQWLRVATTYPKKDGTTGILDPLVRCTFEAKISAGVHPLTNNILSTAKQDHAVALWTAHPEPMLVLSRFRSPIADAAERFKAAGARVGVITGDTPRAEREAIRAAFQAGLLDIVVAQTIPVKMGLDFSALGRLVYLSNSFSHDDRAQSEDRGQHANRVEPYEVLDICTEETHDEILTNVLTMKKENANLYTKAWAQDIIAR